MTTLKAGFGRADITPHKGGRLVGYGGRDDPEATDPHQPERITRTGTEMYR